MTGNRLLQVKLLSSSGEVLSCVNCHFGQITVLRATLPSDLKPYQRALAGIPGPERFAITIDGGPFLPEDHTVIGFGEHFFGDDGSVTDILIKAGVPEDAVDSVCLSFGLEHLTLSPVTRLTLCEERRIRLIAGLYTKNTALVFNEPFEALSGQWKERFAEYILMQMESRPRFLVITTLTYRPEAWVEQSRITKVIVGESIQKTIGFGSGESEMMPLINQLRQAHRDALMQPPVAQPQRPASNLTAAAPKMPAADAPQRGIHALPLRPLALLLGFAFLGVFSVAVFRPSRSEVVSVAPMTPAPVAPPTNVPTDLALQPIIPVNPVQPSNPEFPVDEVVERPQFVLDGYSPDIREAVIAGFEGAPLRAVASAESPGSTPPKRDGDNLFSMLQEAGSTGKNSDAGSNPPYSGAEDTPSEEVEEDAPADPSDETAKREMIRQKFLEAIQNAAERRKLRMPNEQIE